jgi:lipopolysaccharide/colanic/teichoic acid biosynthesis glycosyltransferase
MVTTQAQHVQPTLPLLSFWLQVADNDGLHHQAKRLMDIILSLTALLCLLPLFGLISLIIKGASSGPIFYKSPRIGKNYEPFLMYKFRTMSVDADAQRDLLRAEANLDGQLFKLQDDPRITWVGRFLRASSLDELPQLLNVLKGDMSLVGPRPLPPDESAYFKSPYTIRFKVLPGITGAWQVGGRSNSDFETLCRLEFNYLHTWSLLQDIHLLFATIPAVLASRGAC